MATLRRRNGLLSSCEPCRKSKLRCDHQRPVCERCITRGQETRCFYHPSPSSQSSPSHKRALGASQRLRRQRRSDNQIVFHVNDSPIQYTANGSITSTRLDDQVFAGGLAMEKRPLTPGYLSLAFPGDILSEYDPANTENRDKVDHFQNHSLPDQTTSDNVDQIYMGMQILQQLKHINWFRDLVKKKYSITGSWFLGPPITDLLFDAVEQVYSAALHDAQDTQASLLDLSRQIFKNTITKIQVDKEVKPSQYISMIASRWDTIGVLFQLLVAASIYIPESDLVFTKSDDSKMDKNKLQSRSTIIGEICFQFCHKAGITSDPLCWLATQQTVSLAKTVGQNGMSLLSSTFHSTNRNPWRRLSNLAKTGRFKHHCIRCWPSPPKR